MWKTGYKNTWCVCVCDWPLIIFTDANSPNNVTSGAVSFFSLFGESHGRRLTLNLSVYTSVFEANTESGCAGADALSRPRGSGCACECPCRFWGRFLEEVWVLPDRGGAAAVPGTPHSSWSPRSLSPDSRTRPRILSPAPDTATGGSCAAPASMLLLLQERWGEDSVFCSDRTTAAPCQR